MVLDAKPVTYLNSARVSFANRRKNGDSFAKALATRGSPCCWAAITGMGHRVNHAGVRAWVVVVGRAASRVGPRCEFVLQFSSDLQMFIQYSF